MTAAAAVRLARAAAASRRRALIVGNALESGAKPSVAALHDKRIDRKVALLGMERQLESIAQQRLHHHARLFGTACQSVVALMS